MPTLNQKYFDYAHKRWTSAIACIIKLSLKFHSMFFKSTSVCLIHSLHDIDFKKNDAWYMYLLYLLLDSYGTFLIYPAAATGMKWVEVKMKELGVTSHPNYKISFMLDSLAMISVHTPKYGVIEVKIKIKLFVKSKALGQVKKHN